MVSNNTEHESNEGGSPSAPVLDHRRGTSSGSEDETDGTVKEGGNPNNRKGKGREIPRSRDVEVNVKESNQQEWRGEGGGSVLS